MDEKLIIWRRHGSTGLKMCVQGAAVEDEHRTITVCCYFKIISVSFKKNEGKAVEGFEEESEGQTQHEKKERAADKDCLRCRR